MKKKVVTKQSVKTPAFRFRLASIAVLTGILATAWITGCNDGDRPATGQQTSTPPSPSSAPPAPPADSQEPSGSATTPTLESVLSAWQQGDKATAVSRFVQVDWTARPLFASNSVLNLSETQFQAIPRSSHRAQLEELMSHVSVLKGLARAVATAAEDAAARKDFAEAKRHLTSMRHCGEALSGPDFSVLVQQVGQSMRRLADEKSVTLAQ